MAKPIEKITASFIKRNARQRGPTSSAVWNDNGEEIAQDLTNLVSQWNNGLLPLTSTLPQFSNDINAFVDGLSGKTLYVDNLVKATDNSNYWNSGQNRPNSVKEQFDALYTQLDNSLEELENTINATLPAAPQIEIKDAGNLYLSNNVEDALQEVMQRLVDLENA